MVQVCSILATTNPQVGLSVAYPIMQASLLQNKMFCVPKASWRGIQHESQAVFCIALQSGLFVGGAIGVLFFHELRGREQIGYWLSGIVLIAGVTMLAFSK